MIDVTAPAIVSVGDLVKIKKASRPPYLQNQIGLISDILEDDCGTAYFEVHFIDDRGWFQSFEIEKVSANLVDS